MKQLLSKLTYANVMATIAVFLVLGGGAAVAAGGLGRGSVGTFQLQRGAVTSSKIQRGAVTGGKLSANLSSKVAIRSAVVLAKGTIVPSQSDGILQGNVTSPTPGLYCFKGLNPAPRTAVASFAFETEFKSEIFVAVNPTEGGCKGSQVAVATEKEGGGFSAQPFAIIIH